MFTRDFVSMHSERFRAVSEQRKRNENQRPREFSCFSIFFFGSRFIFRGAETETPSVFLYSETKRKRLLRRLMSCLLADHKCFLERTNYSWSSQLMNELWYNPIYKIVSRTKMTYGFYIECSAALPLIDLIINGFALCKLCSILIYLLKYSRLA